MADERNKSTSATHRSVSPWPGLCIAVGACAAVWLVGSVEASAASHSERTADRGWTVSSIIATPIASVTFTAPPMVTRPTQTVARFSVDPLPLVAMVVGARLMDQIILSQHGGRHGP